MNKSLTALDKLCDLATQDSDCLNYVIGLGMSIKQDLEAYEQLKQDHNITLINNGELVVKVADLQKENQELIINKNVAQAVAFDQKREIGELKDQLSHLKEESEEWQSAYEWSQAKNAILKLENQELKDIVIQNFYEDNGRIYFSNDYPFMVKKIKEVLANE